MQEKILKLTSPYIQKVEKSKQYDEKLYKLKHQHEVLKEIDPLELTLQQFVELEHVADFIHYLTTHRPEIGGVRLDNNSVFNKINQVIAEEMNNDTELKTVAEPFINTVLGSAGGKVDKLQADYDKAFKVALNRILDVVNPLIDDYIVALKHNNPNGNYRKMFEDGLPKPLAKHIIEQWQEYQDEKRKVQQKTYPVPNVFLKLK